jgi:hypothetical protein
MRAVRSRIALLMGTVEDYRSTNSVLFCRAWIHYCCRAQPCPYNSLWGRGAKKVIFCRGATTPLDFCLLNIPILT